MDGASESDANGVDGGERNNNDEGGPEFVDGGKAGGGVFSERHGGRGDGGRESDDEGDPASDEADGGMKDAAEDLVFAAVFGLHGDEFGVGECAEEGDDAADDHENGCDFQNLLTFHL